MSRERSEQRPDRFAVGDRIDAQVVNIDKRDRKLSLSIKAHETAEEKRAMADYGSSDSGASLGDILGAALDRAREDTGDDDAPVEAAAETAPEAEEAPVEEPATEEPATEEPEDAAEGGDENDEEDKEKS
ncbi:MAG: hypothetical protein CMM12_02255 [Rhodospirillaceae bacterium]|nr:hypothetical protein [Rhodospirillaceae bacterium]